MLAMIKMTARSAMNCALMIAFIAPIAVSAAEPVAPAKPAPVAKPKPRPYQAAVHNNITAAYEYRTRILAGKPECLRFATESDAAFIDEKMSSEAKVALLQRIGAEAGAKSCLAP